MFIAPYGGVSKRQVEALSAELTCNSLLAAAGFGTDVALTNAYGFAVSGVLICTTTFIALAIVYLKG